LTVPVLWVLREVCPTVPQNLVWDAICWGFSGHKNLTLLTLYTNILLPHNGRKLYQQYIRHQPNTNKEEQERERKMHSLVIIESGLSVQQDECEWSA